MPKVQKFRILSPDGFDIRMDKHTFTKKQVPQELENFVKRYSEKTPLARMATEDDFRGAISFLATDLSKYVTGQVLSVDGGWGVW